MKKYDFVIAGGGIIGLTVARALSLRRLGSVCVLEKESELGVHASGHNSGVLHAGIYYSPDTLKARMCAKGSQMMQEYADEHAIPWKKTGKVIVTATEPDLAELEKLYNKALLNNVRAEMIDEKKLKQIEPEAKTYRLALYSPDTAVIESLVVLEKLEEEILRLGGEIHKEEAVRHVDSKNRIVRTKKERYVFGYFINAAGLHADEIAHRVGVGLHYRILPFKGIYQKISERMSGMIHGLIYPVPNPAMPFLGVHLTKAVNGGVMAGPTAIPALGRENYGLIRGIGIRDLPSLLRDLLIMFFQNRDGFRNLVKEEVKKYRRKVFLSQLQQLTPAIKSEDLLPSGKVGVRAQLIDGRSMRFVMDFVVEEGPSSLHILNAVSPGFTSSFAFAEMVIDKIRGR